MICLNFYANQQADQTWNTDIATGSKAIFCLLLGQSSKYFILSMMCTGLQIKCPNWTMAFAIHGIGKLLV